MRTLAWAGLLANAAAAHDLELTFRQASPAVIVQATYAGTDPAAHCVAQVYAPGGLTQEFQNGRTDARGLFSFVPDRAGTWRVFLDDEAGHRKDIAIPVGAESLAATPVSNRSRVFQQLVTGLSTILGLTGMLLWWRARRR